MKTAKVRTFLWFDDNAEEAVRFYTSVFKNSTIDSIGPMICTFSIEGQQFMALNGGPHYKLTPAISLFVDCKDQAEVDALWETLAAGGETSRCGWLTDKFGLSWQIIPSALGELMGDDDEEKSGRVMEAMLKMTKIDVEALERAHAG